MSQQGYSPNKGLAPQRQTACHGTSSALSSSANPDENWTQVSGIVERRRIQNRIAQRNYRKKLKRRLQDLERRAGLSSTSPPQIYTKLKQTVPEVVQNTREQSPSSPLQANDDFLPLDRGHSNTSPLPSYAQYSPSNDPSTPRYCPTDNYDYARMTLPAHAFELERRNDISAFSMSYAAMPSFDVPFQNDDPLMPPLCHAFDFDVIDNEHYAQDERSNWPPSPPL
ncbi:hypothetical protein V490_00661 [Pseudogymnoascus sp. VKM F-3557]|nr:hypothetical protein V490_00661 [Pseudogymnoascus sp. VKM F-3557]